MKIVQVGACRGNDHVTKLIKDQYVESIILVEANPLNIDELKNCYKNQKNCIIENLAIGIENVESVRLYYSVNDGPGYEVSSLNKQHILKHGYREDSIQYYDVKCITLNELLKSHNMFKFDYLFLDIEGLDSEICLKFDASKYDIKNIQIEKLHLGDNYQKVLNHFIEFGYELHEGMDLHGYDILFKKIK